MNEPWYDVCHYTPEKVRHIVRNWPEIVARSQAIGASSRGIFAPGPTPESPRTGARQKGHHGDPMHFVAEVADIKQAADALADVMRGTLEHIVIARALEGWSVSRVARVQQIGKERTWIAFNKATELMAIYLGWSPPSD